MCVAWLEVICLELEGLDVSFAVFPDLCNKRKWSYSGNYFICSWYLLFVLSGNFLHDGGCVPGLLFKLFCIEICGGWVHSKLMKSGKYIVALYIMSRPDSDE